MIRKYRKGLIFKQDFLEIDGHKAEIETSHQIHSAAFSNRRLEFFKVRSSFPASYYVGRNRYTFKHYYSINTIESRGVVYQIKWRKPYYQIWVEDQEIATLLINTRNCGDVSLACTDYHYRQICHELALAISLKKVDNQTLIYQIVFITMILLVIFSL